MTTCVKLLSMQPKLYLQFLYYRENQTQVSEELGSISRTRNRGHSCTFIAAFTRYTLRNNVPSCTWLVCMTTTPERLTSDFLFRVLDSILTQKTTCPFKMVLFIPFQSLRTGVPYPDPAFLSERYSKEQLVIHRCDDVGPATKFAGLLTYLPLVGAEVTHIYIADDDIILRDHVFRRMEQILHLRCSVPGNRFFRRMVEMLRVRRPRQDYRRLVLANDAGSFGGMATVAGYAGILAPLGFFRELADDDRLAPVWADLAMNRHPCFNVDDILLSRLFQRFNYTVEGTGLNPFADVMDRALTDEHPAWFELCKHTSRDYDTQQCLNVNLP